MCCFRLNMGELAEKKIDMMDIYWDIVNFDR